ncbi:hypothetical protein GCM10023194_80860 [Planotetraspora phitsanulokensis]|uniref:Uncharacterized protein n=1 Tax=Planotetraspora phitsanulokensis TaxID=575192 RepID=A0A8J3UIB6_9ACTN|nr:hypothetical protein [Planotetraspora phitsanulokensis]GII42824.1 hypothetical protein Pph01_78270 [Planotetraspora phitsanulokensis]
MNHQAHRGAGHIVATTAPYGPGDHLARTTYTVAVDLREWREHVWREVIDEEHHWTASDWAKLSGILGRAARRARARPLRPAYRQRTRRRRR